MGEFLNGMEIDLGRAAHTLTKALDYVGVNDESHGRRVGLICHRIAHHLGWDRQRRHFILLAGMLHDCGVSSTVVHQRLVGEIEWEGADEHCVRGEFFLQSFPPFSHYAEPVRYHHTRWEDLPPDLDIQLKENANLIFLSDRLDVAYCNFVWANPHYKVLQHKQDILDVLHPYENSLFSETLFSAARKAVEKDSFWLELRDEYLDHAIFETLSYGDHQLTLHFDEIEALGELISQIVDAKSPFTHYHSLRVADLTYVIASYLGYDEYLKRTLRLAGLLHDVGKLRTPDEILEKPGTLSPDELAQMKSHPLDSKRVLNAIFPDSSIGKWASEHHEKLDGSGYPFGWHGDQIDQPTRIVTIADIFQALCQKRPYRERMVVDEVLEIMDTMAVAGKIDTAIYQLVKANKNELYQIAIRESA